MEQKKPKQSKLTQVEIEELRKELDMEGARLLHLKSQLAFMNRMEARKEFRKLPKTGQLIDTRYYSVPRGTNKQSPLEIKEAEIVECKQKVFSLEEKLKGV